MNITANISITQTPTNSAGTGRYQVSAYVPHSPRPILKFAMSVPQAEEICRGIMTETYKHNKDCNITVKTPTSSHRYSYACDIEDKIDNKSLLPFSTEYDLVGDEVCDMEEFDKRHNIRRWRKYIPDELTILDNENLSMYDRLYLALMRQGYSKQTAKQYALEAELKHKELAEFNKEE